MFRKALKALIFLPALILVMVIFSDAHAGESGESHSRSLNYQKWKESRQKSNKSAVELGRDNYLLHSMGF